MLPERKQQELVERYSLIEDPQERLAAVMARAGKVPALPEAERTEGRRVPGCVSRVWLVPELREGQCRFRIDADSALVKALASLVCEIYEGATPEEVAAVEAEVLQRLGLAAFLSPTRLHGLQQVRRAIREFALSKLSPA